MAIEGLFLPTTEIFDTQQLQGGKLSEEQMKEILIRIVQAFNDSNIAMNLKDTGVYSLDEYVSAQTFFPDLTVSQKPRPAYRKVIDFGGLPNTGTTSVAHGIAFDTNSIGTRIYGTATDPSAAPAGLRKIPIPYASPTLANNIEIDIDSTNVNITTGSDRTAFTKCIVVLEYLAS